jgi:hypothetical protein
MFIVFMERAQRRLLSLLGPPRIPTFEEISQPSSNYRPIGRLVDVSFVCQSLSELLGDCCLAFVSVGHDRD